MKSICMSNKMRFVGKGGPCWEQNFEYELIDVMATCKRALLGDHKHIYGKSPDEQIKRW